MHLVKHARDANSLTIRESAPLGVVSTRAEAVRRWQSHSSYQSKAAQLPSAFGSEQDDDNVNPDPLNCMIYICPVGPTNQGLDQSGQTGGLEGECHRCLALCQSAWR